MKIEFSNSIVIDANPGSVWSVLSDWANPSGWVPQLKSCEMLGPKVGVGARRRIVEEDQVLVEEVIAWSEPREIAIRVTGVPPFVKNVTTTFSIEGIESGRSTFQVHSSSDTGLGLVGMALAPLAKRFQRKELIRLLAAMKYFVESGRRATHEDVDRVLAESVKT